MVLEPAAPAFALGAMFEEIGVFGAVIMLETLVHAVPAGLMVAMSVPAFGG